MLEIYEMLCIRDAIDETNSKIEEEKIKNNKAK